VKRFVPIFLLIVFANLTVSPLLFSSMLFGKATEEIIDIGEEEDNTKEEKESHKTFYNFNIVFNIHFHPEDFMFKSSETKLLSVFIEYPIQPPDHLI